MAAFIPANFTDMRVVKADWLGTGSAANPVGVDIALAHLSAFWLLFTSVFS